jgi:hypothetical protein
LGELGHKKENGIPNDDNINYDINVAIVRIMNIT